MCQYIKVYSVARLNELNAANQVHVQYEGPSLNSRIFVEIFHNHKVILKIETCKGRIDFDRYYITMMFEIGQCFVPKSATYT